MRCEETMPGICARRAHVAARRGDHADPVAAFERSLSRWPKDDRFASCLAE
jgi:hypothetical protein